MIRPEVFCGRDLAALVEQARAGDVVAQEELYLRYAADVERVLYRLLGREQDVADALQDVFIEVLRGLEGLRDPRALPRWLRAVAVGTARKRIRSKARRRWLRFFAPEDVPEVSVNGADDEVLAALRATYAVLDTMGTERRIMFALRHLEQLELTEVAEACRVSVATVKRRLREAEDLFVARARRDPHLADWLREGSKWEPRS